MPQKNDPPLPLSFRSALLERLLASLGSGECCSLVGISGTGKSNVARFLQRHDVQQFYWKDDRTWVISIDSQGLVFNEEQSIEYLVTEMMFSRLIAEAESRKIPLDFLTWASEFYNRLPSSQRLPHAMRTLQETCKRLCEQYGLQLIFMFDQFDDLWQTLDFHFFLNLRNLRDQFKYSVAYLVLIRNRLERIRQDTQAVESFWELFSIHTYGLGPYNESDADIMLERLAVRASISASEIPHEIVTMSGGHPALLRAIFFAYHKSSQKSLHIDDLLNISSVVQECEKVWLDFSPAEKQVIGFISQQLPLSHTNLEPLNDLYLKGVLFGDPPKLFSPLFATFVVQKLQINISGIVVDPRLRQVWLDGKLLQEPLSPLEYGLLEYLARHQNAICKRSDVLDALYPSEVFHGNTDQRLDALLSRLRKALGETASNPRYIMTLRGGGIQLLHGVINDTVAT